MRISKLYGILAIVGLFAWCAAAPPALADSVLGTGLFAGKSNHVTRGKVELVKTDTGFEVRLGRSFNFDGAPDPKVMLGKRGSKQRFVISHLTRNRGAQNYKLPAGVDGAKYDEVWIWCQRYSVPLGYARLKGG